MKINIKKILTSKKHGSALFIFIMLFFGIFIIAFGSGYLVFLSLSKASNYSDGLKAYYAAYAGVERVKYEAIKNNYDFSANCSSSIFTTQLSNESSYNINCVNNSGTLSFYSVGTYNNSQVAQEIKGINILAECSTNYLAGSLCGGGKLIKTTSTSLVISPSGCTSTSTCDNSFVNADPQINWESPTSSTLFGATSTTDGVANITILNPQTNTALLAAKFCDDATFNGFSDWYLPAAEQLLLLADKSSYQQYFNLTSSPYWTSTEVDADLSYVADISADNFSSASKSEVHLIRCIRNIE
ncbi:MAG TPA: DUF1566 domain-containing protein [bacterium]|nr:DUF1566 domain-containing protein [bacterium]